jgi:hypothetical protein
VPDNGNAKEGAAAVWADGKATTMPV